MIPLIGSKKAERLAELNSEAENAFQNEMNTKLRKEFEIPNEVLLMNVLIEVQPAPAIKTTQAIRHFKKVDKAQVNKWITELNENEYGTKRSGLPAQKQEEIKKEEVKK